MQVIYSQTLSTMVVPVRGMPGGTMMFQRLLAVSIHFQESGRSMKEPAPLCQYDLLHLPLNN